MKRIKGMKIVLRILCGAGMFFGFGYLIGVAGAIEGGDGIAQHMRGVISSFTILLLSVVTGNVLEED